MDTFSTGDRVYVPARKTYGRVLVDMGITALVHVEGDTYPSYAASRELEGPTTPDTPARCDCTDPTPVYGNVTHAWYCYDCGADLTPAQVDGYASRPVRSIV